MIVTLAGHVDHGKTSLVRALTGVDTDSLAQEKQRGLTIDLGFAYLDEGRIGFVDVPGHHRFIHNMVAGVARNQFAMLVVAADDGPMPQTVEHLQILTLAGLQRGIVVLTKVDRVDAERVQQVRSDIAALLRNTFLSDAPVVETSVATGVGIEPLHAALISADEASQTLSNDAPFRLAVDRAFSLKGVGLVVTGTVHSGCTRVDDRLFHSSTNTQVRVRSIRTQDRDADAAQVGDRCALSITGIDQQQVARGDWLEATAGEDYRELTLALDLLSDLPRALKHWTPVHAYLATSHRTARLALHTADPLKPGQQTLADLILDEPLRARHGDQLILRDHSLDITIGGGRVIHGSPRAARRRRAPERLQSLDCFNTNQPRQALARLLERQPVALSQFQALWHLSDEQFADLIGAANALRVNDLLIGRPFMQNQAEYALQHLKQHLQTTPDSPGLRENQFSALHAELRQGVLNGLVSAGGMSREGAYYTLPQHRAELPGELGALWPQLQSMLDREQVPSTGDISKQLNIPQHQLESALKELHKRGYVVQVAAHRFYLPAHLKALADRVVAMCQTRPLTVRDFRDATGIGRNIAIEILEYFDARGFTRRNGNERIVINPDLELR